MELPQLRLRATYDLSADPLASVEVCPQGRGVVCAAWNIRGDDFTMVMSRRSRAWRRVNRTTIMIRAFDAPSVISWQRETT